MDHYLDIFEAKSSDNLLYINKNIVDSVVFNYSVYVFKRQGNDMSTFELLDQTPKGEVLKKRIITFEEGRIGEPFKNDIFPHYKVEADPRANAGEAQRRGRPAFQAQDSRHQQ